MPCRLQKAAHLAPGVHDIAAAPLTDCLLYTSYLPSVVTAALEKGTAQVTVLTSSDRWHGITYREDKPELVEALRRMSEEGLYPKDRLF